MEIQKRVCMDAVILQNRWYRFYELSLWIKHGGAFRAMNCEAIYGASYFPIQNFEKMLSSKSSVVISPVISPR